MIKSTIDFSKPITFLVLGCLLANGCAAPTTPTRNSQLPSNHIEKQKPFLTSVKTNELFKALNIAQASGQNSFSPLGVTYALDGVEGARSLSIGVFSSEAKANTVFDQVKISAAGFVEAPKGLGDQFAGFGTADKYGLRFRRHNIIISFSWRGKLEDAIAFGRKIDGYIQNPDGIFTKGNTLDSPKVEIASPTLVAVDTDLLFHYKTESKNKVAAISTVSRNTWSDEGEFSFTAQKLGPQTQVVTFISADNLVFDKVVEFTVLSKAEFELSSSKKSWSWPSKQMYFKKQADQDYASTALSQKEWMELEMSTFQSVTLDGALFRRVIDDLNKVIQPQWLPQKEQVEVFFDHATSVNQEVYSATFSTLGYNLIYKGVLGKGGEIYIEQPVTKSKNLKLITAGDVFKNDLYRSETKVGKETTFPSVALLGKTFNRYRAFQVDGPWEEVNILVLRYTLPEGDALPRRIYP